ncbi:Protein Smaug 2 [Schistosoma japonicum]|nr:Protein Smaug 2 [Schistosoma japonicum]KAH8859159.1 Protein Smaug 2 [Schistosoma japonicum]
MTAVPFWLKSLRLHKYTNLFRNLSYDEMMNITDDWLKEQSLSDMPSTDQLTQTTLQSCLSEIKHILLTPIKPFFKTTTHFVRQVNSCSPTATRNSSSSIPASACVVATNLEMPTTIQTATPIIDSTCPTSISPSTIYVDSVDSAKNAFNTTASNNAIKNCNNNCFNCSTNTLNHATNDSNLLDYCCICNANSPYAENKCYLNREKQQLDMMTNHANHVFNDNNNNDKCWSSSMTSTQVHNLPNYTNRLQSESRQSECSDYGSDECADQKRTNDNANTDSDDNIPGQIIACLTKVCSSLLVAAYPGTHLYEEFLQILEIILNHVAFCEHQKKLVSYWKHRVIIVYVQYITQLPNSSKSKSEFKSNVNSRHLPHVHYSDSRLSKLSDIGQEQQLGPPTASRTIHFNTLPPSAICLHNTQDTSYFTQDSSDMPQPIIDTSYAGANMSLIIPGAVEASRRHSTSVDDSRNFLAIGRLNNRRRMPSPNSSCFSGRSGLSTNLPSTNSSFSRHPQASSDMELSGFPSQLPRPRFHSPSRFDPSTNVTPKRNLMPVATAPVTRMPSPSDVCRHGICYNDWFTSNNRGAFSTVPLPSNMLPISGCERSCSENVISDTPLIQRPRTPNAPTSMSPSQNSFHKTHSSCSCTPTTSMKLTIPQMLTLTSPTHMIKTMHQHIHPSYYESSGNFLTSLSCTPVPCIPNPNAIDNVYHSTFGSLCNQTLCDNPQQHSINNSNCSTTKSPQSYFEVQQINSSKEIPEVYSSYWSGFDSMTD